MKILLSAIFALFAPLSASSAPLEDNSFLLEEAYNQEPGVYQFIQVYQFNKTSPAETTETYAFTVEAPLYSQRHQLSFTMPFQTLETTGTRNSGIADTFVHYRYSLLDKKDFTATPRISVILPTGKKESGLGTGSIGAQFAAALSLNLNEYFVTHWNMGFTLVPSAKTVSNNFAASLVYLFNDNLNFLVEFFNESKETADDTGTKSRSESYYINPGVRYAHNFGETQLVPGISFPVGVAASEAEDYGILLYLSLEGKPF